MESHKLQRHDSSTFMEPAATNFYGVGIYTVAEESRLTGCPLRASAGGWGATRSRAPGACGSCRRWTPRIRSSTSARDSPTFTDGERRVQNSARKDDGRLIQW